MSSSPRFRGSVRRPDNPTSAPRSFEEDEFPCDWNPNPGDMEGQRCLGSGKELSRVVTSVGLKVYPSFSARYGVRELVRPAAHQVVVWLSTGPDSCNPLFSIVSFSPCFLLKLLHASRTQVGDYICTVYAIHRLPRYPTGWRGENRDRPISPTDSSILPSRSGHANLQEPQGQQRVQLILPDSPLDSRRTSKIRR